MKNLKFSRRWCVWALSLSVVCQSACVPPSGNAQQGGEGAPRQRPMLEAHVRVQSVVTPVSTAAQVAALLTELKSSELANDATYVTPEEIVAMAIAEFEQGNPWDSALLLSIATYRYRQQMRRASRLTELEISVGNSAGARFQSLEREMLTHSMEGEVAGVRVYLRALTATGVAQPKPVFDKPDTVDEPYPLGSSDERLAHPELAKAYLARLQADEQQGGEYNRGWLETVPLVSFRRAALVTMRDFHPLTLVPDTRSQQAALRADQLAALRSSRPENRSAAAFLLGIVKDASAREALQAALREEREPRVQASLWLALARLGDDAQLANLEQSAQASDSALSGLTLSLMGALPRHLLERVQPGLVSRVLLDNKMSFEVRYRAAKLLAGVAEARPLSEPELMALVRVCAEGRTGLSEVPCHVLGGLKQLNRERVLQLMAQFPSAAPGLFARWAEVAEAPDLAALEREFEAARSNKKRLNQCVLLVKAVGRIDGSAATEQLSNWYVRIEDQFTALWIAAEWSRRADASGAARDALRARVDEPKRLFLSVAAGDSRAEGDAAAVIDFRSLYGAAYLTAFRKVPGESATPLLWKLASYHDPKTYPADAGVRWRAVASLMHLAVVSKLPTLPEP